MSNRLFPVLEPYDLARVGVDAFVNGLTLFQRDADPFSISKSTLNALSAWSMHPLELMRAGSAMWRDAAALQVHLVARAFGIRHEDVIAPHAEDPRFVDSDWSNEPTWDIIKESYLVIAHRVQDMLFRTPGLSAKERRRAAFWVRNWLNAMAPTNFFASNPVAIRRFFESGGTSAVRGALHFLRDVRAKHIRMVDPDSYKVGVNLAVTPGSVIFRNRMLELLHYTPTTARVHETPIVIVTPWINKFYVLDLSPRRSFVKYMVDQGFSVFVTSWKNPTAEMAQVGFDDYLCNGVVPAIEAAQRVCQSRHVHLVGYCIGGTLVATYMAWAARRYGDKAHPVAHWTLLATLTDFSNPGDIDVFVDDISIDALDAHMAQTGYLSGEDMAMSFRLLRSNRLIWRFVELSYLLGESLPPIDVLFWNMDTTRLPAAMHSFYLREMYLHNRLIERDALTIAGEPIDLNRITQPLYAVTAEEDHIAPWRESYRIRRYINGKAPMRFVLTSSGHIFGIINPVVVPPKRNFLVAEPEHNEEAEHWRAGAEDRSGTWWEDWIAWLSPLCGPMVTPPKLNRTEYSDLGPAPGTYVFEK